MGLPCTRLANLSGRISLALVLLCSSAALAAGWSQNHGVWSQPDGVHVRIPSAFQVSPTGNRLIARGHDSFVQIMPVADFASARNVLDASEHTLEKKRGLRFSPIKTYRSPNGLLLSTNTAGAKLGKESIEVILGMITDKRHFLVLYARGPTATDFGRKLRSILGSIGFNPTK